MGDDLKVYWPQINNLHCKFLVHFSKTVGGDPEQEMLRSVYCTEVWVFVCEINRLATFFYPINDIVGASSPATELIIKMTDRAWVISNYTPTYKRPLSPDHEV